MSNLVYFLIAVLIMFVYMIIDGISHQKFKKTINLWFHILGISILVISFAILTIIEFRFSVLIYPGILIIIIGFILIYLSYIDIKKDFLRAKKVTRTGIYTKVRHPMYLGLILLYIGISLFSSSLLVSLYSLIAILFIIWQAVNEEKHLIKRFGKEYLNYKKKVPMLVPIKFKELRPHRKV